jgi:hypothetical protein
MGAEACRVEAEILSSSASDDASVRIAVICH